MSKQLERKTHCKMILFVLLNVILYYWTFWREWFNGKHKSQYISKNIVRTANCVFQFLAFPTTFTLNVVKYLINNFVVYFRKKLLETMFAAAAAVDYAVYIK